MTIPEPSPTFTEPYAAPYAAPVARPGRSLAAAIAVFLGGYLLLAGFSGLLGNVSLTLFAFLSGRPAPEYPLAIMVLAVLQFLFAIGVVVAGLLLANGPAGRGIVGAAIVVVGSLLTFAVVGMRFNGLLPFPSGEAGIPFNAVFANSWFAIVLFVGVAWLIARGARVGWLAILGTLILIPLPIALSFADVESGVIQIVMYLLSGIVGAAIILAGRPFRD